jgi:uncharacterized protein (DUF1778 family)
MKNKFLFARVEESGYSLLKKITQARGESISSFVRHAVRVELAKLSRVLSDDDKMVLRSAFRDR